MWLSGLAGVVVAVAVAAAGCGGSSSPPDSQSGGTIVGNERLGWDQPAGDAAEVATFGYALYIDDSRREPLSAACDTTANGVGFPCSSPLPPLSPGTHRLQIVTFVISNPALESPRSVELVVTVSGAVTTTGAPAPATDEESAASRSALPPTQTVRTSTGRSFRVDLTAPLEGVNALAIAPDGRVFAADRFGRIRLFDPTAPRPAVEDALVVPDAAVMAGGGGVVDLALDPQFTETHFVYVLDVADGANGPAFRLARYREVGSRLGERAVLLDGIPASTTPAGTIAVGPDGRLYVALGDGASPANAASYNGKLLRLNADGTTPDDQRAASPIAAGPFASPRSLRWNAEGTEAWLADAGRQRLAILRVQRRTGVTSTPATVPGMDRPSAVAAVRDPVSGEEGVLVGDDAGALILASRPAAGRPGPAATEPLTVEGLTRVRALERAPDGSVLLAADDVLLRITAS